MSIENQLGFKVFIPQYIIIFKMCQFSSSEWNSVLNLGASLLRIASFVRFFGRIEETIICFQDLCLVHVIWTARRMSKLVLSLKNLLLLSFLTAAEFFNLGHIQGIIWVH